MGPVLYRQRPHRGVSPSKPQRKFELKLVAVIVIVIVIVKAAAAAALGVRAV